MKIESHDFIISCQEMRLCDTSLSTYGNFFLKMGINTTHSKRIGGHCQYRYQNETLHSRVLFVVKKTSGEEAWRLKKASPNSVFPTLKIQTGQLFVWIIGSWETSLARTCTWLLNHRQRILYLGIERDPSSVHNDVDCIAWENCLCHRCCSKREAGCLLSLSVFESW